MKMCPLNISNICALVLFAVLLQLAYLQHCNAQVPIDSAYIDQLHDVYNKTVFADSFQQDSLDKLPLNWKGFNRRSGMVHKSLIAVKSYKNDRVLSVLWYNIDLLKVCNDGKDVVLPDSFIIEFDYLFEKYSVTYDSVKINAFLRKVDTFKVDWPKTYMGSWGNGYERSAPRVLDTTNIYTERSYALAQFGPAYNRWVWHHSIIEVKKNMVNCYVVGLHSFKVFTDTAFVFKHLSFGRGERILYRNIAIKSAGNRRYHGGTAFSGLLKNGKLVTRAINFDVNKAVINTGNTQFLNELAGWLHDYPELKIEIDGHTDADGSAAANLLLSKQRAEAIKKWLVLTGIDPQRLTTNGYGATQPLATNSTPEGKALNRRVALLLK